MNKQYLLLQQRNTAGFCVVLAVCLGLAACGGSSGGAPAGPQPNRPPVISGSPPTAITAGQNYSFTPTASDSDGDALTFSVSNLPSWASFNTANGSITGTPTQTDVGLYQSISITVTDGTAPVSLPSFFIDVLSSAGSTLTLSWTPPTTSTDGSPLNDLLGYRIQWGNQSGMYQNVMQVNDQNAVSATVSGLTAGTYYFVVSAVDNSSNESANSNEAMAVVP